MSRTPRTTTDGPRGFTLMELLVVIAIIAVAFAMIASLPLAQRKDGDVRAAAEELAATFRAARSLSMQQMATCAVAFNVRNGEGTSGKVLNNWDGGHWYRIIGPDEIATARDASLLGYNAHYPRPFGTPTYSGLVNRIELAWMGDRHTLPPRKVRFLALTDQDNGSVVEYSDSNSSNWRAFPATYPRPWFGSWSAGRLYPWGGYDTAITDGSSRRCSAFRFQGADSNGGLGVVGSRNPVDRASTTGNIVNILTAGEGRAVVNGNWLDYVIRFFPDGTAEAGPQFEARAAVADLNPLTIAQVNWYGSLMTNYHQHTGGFAITLAGDMDQDTDRFLTARAAMDSIWPIYRVVVSKAGLVQVVKVLSRQPPGTTYDPAINFQNIGDITAKYRGLWATNGKGQPRARPVVDFLTPELLASRQWWMP